MTSINFEKQSTLDDTSSPESVKGRQCITDWFFTGHSMVVLGDFLASKEKQEYRKLTKEEEEIIVDKGTEAPFTGEYYAFWKRGTYACKRCGAALYRSESKFEADCGWPSFDDEIPGAVKRLPDADGVRTEIQCANCGAHLGHVFLGEGFTKKNVRHCVNSISMDFIPDKSEP
jgi:peptide-methionine (R)-S-oxide reductase